MVAPTVKISRNWQDLNQSLGTCSVYNSEGKLVFVSMSLERGWRNNEANISCIPSGSYPIKLEYSNRFKTNLWEIKEVPNRSECKFHWSNFWHQLSGCIALGQRLEDMNKDGYHDATSSKNTIKAFHKALFGYTEANLIVEYSENCVSE